MKRVRINPTPGHKQTITLFETIDDVIDHLNDQKTNEIHSIVIDVNEKECVEAELLGFEYVNCRSDTDIRVNYVQFIVQPAKLTHNTDQSVQLDGQHYVGWNVGDIVFINSETTKVLSADEYDDNVTMLFKIGLDLGVRDEFMPMDDDDDMPVQ